MQELLNGQWVKKNRLRIYEVFLSVNPRGSSIARRVPQCPEEFFNFRQFSQKFVKHFFKFVNFLRQYFLTTFVNFPKSSSFFFSSSSIFPKVRQYFFKFVNFSKSSSISLYLRKFPKSSLIFFQVRLFSQKFVHFPKSSSIFFQVRLFSQKFVNLPKVR